MVPPFHVNVYGLGHVGLVLATIAAKHGHSVCGIENSPLRRTQILSNSLSFSESSISPQDVIGKNNFKLLDPELPIPSALVHLICVGTPTKEDGQLDLSQILDVLSNVVRSLKNKISQKPLVFFRSTLLPGTLEEVILPELEKLSGLKANQDFHLFSYPEFMREGTSYDDVVNPPLHVVGLVPPFIDVPDVGDILRELFRVQKPITVVTAREAETIKISSNVFHAMKIVFSNEIQAFCQQIGVNGQKVMEVFASDDKLNCSRAYLRPGFIYGGPCLPKDVRAFQSMSENLGLELPLIQRIEDGNQAHLGRSATQILKQGWKRIGVVGLAFKPNTTNLKGSPVLDLIKQISNHPSIESIGLFDPFVKRPDQIPNKCNWFDSIEDMLAQCDGVVIFSSRLASSHQDLLVASRRATLSFDR